MSHSAVDRQLAASVELQWRYNHDVVDAFGLCPWAAPSWRAGRVLVAADPLALDASGDADARALGDALKRAAATPVDGASLELVQLVFPYVRCTWRAWELLTAAAAQAVSPGGAAAAFHPEFAWSSARPGGAVRALRRTPDPCVQLIRSDLLPAAATSRFVRAEGVAALLAAPAKTPASEQIRDANLRTMRGPSGPAIRAAQDLLISARNTRSSERD